ncbi:MAG: hypothetical protein V3R73_01375 [Sphingomonadales bacterium]
MILNVRLSAIFLTMALLLAPPVSAAKKDRPVPDELKEYRATGEMQNCVNRFLIDDIEVLSDYTVLFHMTNRKTYKNELPFRCFRLAREQRFGYTLTSSLLCKNDIITVFSTGPFTASCGLGEFEELEKIEKATPGGGGGAALMRP